jgi:hypothetical protein
MLFILLFFNPKILNSQNVTNLQNNFSPKWEK